MKVFNSENLDILRGHLHGNPCFYFIFKGHFHEHTALMASEALKERLQNSYNKYSFIWDCQWMEGFDFAAKEEWESCIDFVSRKVSNVILITKENSQRGAARRMCKNLNLPLIVVADLTELHERAA